MTEGNRFLLKRKPTSDSAHYKNFYLFGVKNDVTINNSLHNLLFVLSQKVLIAETKLNVLSGDINKVLSIKTTLQPLKLILLCYEQFFV